MTTRRHDMPFGAQITAQGVRFRLWAPHAEAVSLCIEGEAALPMADQGEGWFELVTTRAGPGTRYRFALGDGFQVPDPASRHNPDDVHGASRVVDPAAFAWQDEAWHGRPWNETVIYELHVGTFSPEGTFAGVTRRLAYLADLGVTAIELMPVADFPGRRGWGYDGVLPFAPDSSYGTPEDLKTLIQAAHAHGLMVFLDVVYNHFGPEGNYLHVYARPFFSDHRETPWGAAIDFAGSREVREFFIHNALYWLEEYHLDGLRLDAVHAIFDDSEPHFLTELAARVRTLRGTRPPPHLILENDANQARYLQAGGYAAQWNDDLHHALHVLCTGERDGYYADYAEAPLGHLGRCLAEGFAWHGEASAYRHHATRGEPSAYLPPQAFVAFLQCHDQVGNRLRGERIVQLAPAAAVRAAQAIVLLAPSIPMLFMGEEFAAATPFQFFCDFSGVVGANVSAGRKREFAEFAGFATAKDFPDPAGNATFEACKLDWSSLHQARHKEWLAWCRELLALRQNRLVPRLMGMGGRAASYRVRPPGGLRVGWRLGDGSTLWLLANLCDQPMKSRAPPGTVLYAGGVPAGNGMLAPWSVLWTLDDA